MKPRYSASIPPACRVTFSGGRPSILRGLSLPSRSNGVGGNGDETAGRASCATGTPSELSPQRVTNKPEGASGLLKFEEGGEGIENTEQSMGSPFYVGHFPDCRHTASELPVEDERGDCTRPDGVAQDHPAVVIVSWLPPLSGVTTLCVSQ